MYVLPTTMCSQYSSLRSLQVYWARPWFLMYISNILVKKTGAHWVCPSTIPFFSFCSKSKWNYWSSVIICISIGNYFNFPVEWWCLEITIIFLKLLQNIGKIENFLFLFMHYWILSDTNCCTVASSYLYWNRWSGIDKRAPRKSPTCARISQKGHSCEMWWKHACSHRGKHSWWAPSDFFGLQRGREHFIQLQLK